MKCSLQSGEKSDMVQGMPKSGYAHVMPQANDNVLLRVQDLRVHFGGSESGGVGSLLAKWGGSKVVKAVDGVSFSIEAGTTLGLVGESGSGKSTVGRAILGLLKATSGSCTFEGKEVLAKQRDTLSRTARVALRRKMQIIFQDPAGSLNPRMRVGDAIAEPMIAHGLCEKRVSGKRACELLERCGLQASAAEKYPHELSGGQKQRAVIARALAVEPVFLVCDEPTSALDVSIQAQILNLLTDLQRDLGLAYLFISHDLAVVQHMSHNIAVMQHGVIVESGDARAVLREPSHAYTQRLLSAVV
jgi:ABC-type glutathione transport system ATPase component